MQYTYNMHTIYIQYAYNITTPNALHEARRWGFKRGVVKHTPL